MKEKEYVGFNLFMYNLFGAKSEYTYYDNDRRKIIWIIGSTFYYIPVMAIFLFSLIWMALLSCNAVVMFFYYMIAFMFGSAIEMDIYLIENMDLIMRWIFSEYKMRGYLFISLIIAVYTMYKCPEKENK